MTMNPSARCYDLVAEHWQAADHTLITLFRAVVARQPETLALVGGEQRYSYRQLDEISDRLAGYLIAQGVTPRSIVAILLDKSADYILTALAALKAQAAYLPLELAYPQRFIEQIFQEAEPALVVTKTTHCPQLPSDATPRVLLDSDPWQAAIPLEGSAPTVINGSDLAILGYSSGTTGQPKGVKVSHRATLYAYARFWQELVELNDVTHFAYTTFIAWDALNPLSAGASGFVVPDAYCYDPLRLVNFFEQHQINHTVFTPSLLNSILLRLPVEELRQKLRTLELIWLGGEVTTHTLVARAMDALPQTTLLNNYGPTECFVITQGKLRRDDPLNPSSCASVGYVLPEMTIRLQNEQGEPVHRGEVGELLATGPCLADGYLAKPQLTAEKFITLEGVTYYRTGDDAFLLEDGRLVVTGRHDSTVKVRGYNINLSAVEAVLKKEADVADCVVLAIGEEGEDKYLAAFVVPTATTPWQVDKVTLSAPELSQLLAHHLAHYMIPTAYLALEAIPIDSASQKADKGQLRQMAKTARSRPSPALSLSHQSPQELSPREQQVLLRTVVEQLLSLPPHSLLFHESLFDKGLHSLMAVELALRIEELFGCRIFIEDIFQLNSITALIAHIHGHHVKNHDSLLADAEFHWSEPLPPLAVNGLAAAQQILITGATGFIGSYMLHELLHRTQATLVCLVRPHQRPPLERILRRFQFHQLEEPADLHQRVRFVWGNLSEPAFGLEPAEYQQLCGSIDMVFHCAAMVNFILSYQQMKTTNVDGTQELLRFALRQRLKPVHYISTTGVYPEPSAALVEVEQFDEVIVPEALIPRLYTGYSISKCVAEKVIDYALKIGVPINRYRPGNVGPDCRHHIANPQDTLLLVLNACRRIRAAPMDKAWYFEATPVDFVVEAIVSIAEQQQPLGQSLNITSTPIEANRVFQRLLERGEIEELIPFTQWLKRLQQVGRECGEPMLQIMADTILTEEKFFIADPGLSTRQFDAQLRACGLEMPVMSADYCVAFR